MWAEVIKVRQCVMALKRIVTPCAILKLPVFFVRIKACGKPHMYTFWTNIVPVYTFLLLEGLQPKSSCSRFSVLHRTDVAGLEPVTYHRSKSVAMR